jgi:hypothetical protein
MPFPHNFPAPPPQEKETQIREGMVPRQDVGMDSAWWRRRRNGTEEHSAQMGSATVLGGPVGACLT